MKGVTEFTVDEVKKYLAHEGPDGYSTIQEWLWQVLTTFIYEGEGFSGKRPLGESGWHYGLSEAARFATHNSALSPNGVDKLGMAAVKYIFTGNV